MVSVWLGCGAVLALVVEAWVEGLAEGSRVARWTGALADVVDSLWGASVLAWVGGARVVDVAGGSRVAGRAYTGTLVAVWSWGAAVFAGVDEAWIEDLKYWTHIV